ncbi:MAG: ankyrin repeat domain-containing protein [Patescibacteria group bacterium]|nr:ankyrin repeat domain-containing protein [Patescibacteria group bacterium]
MSEMEGFEPNPKDELILAINAGSLEKVQEFIGNLEDVQLSESVLETAESTGDSEIVTAVLDHILENGLDVPHDFPTQLHWAISRGFRHSAAYLAEIAMEQDLAEKDENGNTPLELARSKGYDEVVAALENWGE